MISIEITPCGKENLMVFNSTVNFERQKIFQKNSPKTIFLLGFGAFYTQIL